MTLDDINNLDPKEIGIWPWPAKLAVILVVCAGLAYAGWYFHLEEQMMNLEKVQKDELNLRKDFETKQVKAVNLERYRQQLADLKESLGTMLQQLPNKTEVPALLVDVSQTGLAAGLEFKRFQPAGERKLEFYAELPINIEVVGNYHQFGDFVSGLASLPRIVTIHNINITPIGGGKGGQQLNLKAVAKTYRYLDESETPKPAAKGKPKPKGRK
ncbi:MAG: type 4a pilus biogenesis protein PilO [Gammaproteobacteria bacterium]|nr:type 4a pilus biogenesis protein PilO [Gammaproteobacteria bacterium]